MEIIGVIYVIFVLNQQYFLTFMLGVIKFYSRFYFLSGEALASLLSG
jgi:hypothetical protein